MRSDHSPARLAPGRILLWLAASSALVGCAGELAAQPKPLVVMAESSLADDAAYDAWVEFTDKGRPTRAQRLRIRAALEREFHPHALARRKVKRTRPGLFDELDEPLAAEYLRAVTETGARIQIASRWLNGVTVIADKAALTRIKGLPFVKKVSDFHRRRERAQGAPATDKTRVPPKASSFYGAAEPQIRRLKLDALHAEGYTGRGVRVAVIDCGFDLAPEAFHHPEHPLRIAEQRDFVENDGDVRPRPGIDPANYGHGTLVLGAIAAYLPGIVVGSAFDADVILCSAEDGEEEYYLEERWFVAALEFAESRGADLVSSSLVLYSGYKRDQVDGRTSVMTQGLNIAAANGVICFCGAGNDGHDEDPATGTVSPPADAPDAISVGAVVVGGTIAEFSSDGPTVDGRLKPEILSQGSPVATVSLTDRRGFGYSRGTSLATPVVAGAGACLLQVHPEWTVRDFRKALFESGDLFLRQGRPDPLFVHGYGVPDVFRASGLKRRTGRAAGEPEAIP
jgi:subtilisin family serine protease